MVKTLERHCYPLREKHVFIPFSCSHQMHCNLAGRFGINSCRHCLDGARWIAQEIFAEDHAYTLNVLLLCQDDALRELSISFDSMEALA